MRILGIDYGLRHVGLAISDESGLIAQGLDSIHYKGSLDFLIRKIEEVVKSREVTEVVVGHPLNMDGTRGEKAGEAEHFAEELKKNTRLPVHLWDERLTTASVEREFSRWKVGSRKQKKLVDRLSAQLILQSYLDFQRSPSKS